MPTPLVRMHHKVRAILAGTGPGRVRPGRPRAACPRAPWHRIPTAHVYLVIHVSPTRHAERRGWRGPRRGIRRSMGDGSGAGYAGLETGRAAVEDPGGGTLSNSSPVNRIRRLYGNSDPDPVTPAGVGLLPGDRSDSITPSGLPAEVLERRKLRHPEPLEDRRIL